MLGFRESSVDWGGESEVKLLGGGGPEGLMARYRKENESEMQISGRKEE